MVKRDLIANYLGQGWSALMGVAFGPLDAHYLGIEAYGLIGVFAMLSAWLALLDLGMSPTLGREMARFSAGSHTAQSVRELLWSRLYRRAFLQLIYDDLPAVRGGDRLFIWKMALTNRFRYTGNQTYFRLVATQPAHVRYRESVPSLAHTYRSNREYWKTLRAAPGYPIASSEGLTASRILVTVMVARYALFLAVTVAKAEIRQLLARWS